MKGHLYRNS